VVQQEVYDYLRSICADVHVTKGDFDDQKGYPEDEVLSIGDFRIGLCHGHQVRAANLLSLAIMLDNRP
jgi:vacuolar protein sorting-associated protein 29